MTHEKPKIEYLKRTKYPQNRICGANRSHGKMRYEILPDNKGVRFTCQHRTCDYNITLEFKPYKKHKIHLKPKQC